MNEPIAWTNKKNLKYLQVAGGANIWNQSIEKNDIPLYTQTFLPPKKWTNEEIKNGYKGIRWIAQDGVYGIPTPDDVINYLGYTHPQKELSDAEIIDAWKMFPNWGHEQHILMFGRELLKKANEK